MKDTRTKVTLSLFHSWSNLNEQTDAHPAAHAAEAAKGADDEEATTQAPVTKKAVGLTP